MWQSENVFRLILAVGFAVLLPIGLFYRLKSQSSKEKLNRLAEGRFMLLTLRPIAAIGFLAFLLYLIQPAWMAWSSLQLPVTVRWIGVGLGFGAGCLLIAVYRTLGANLTDTVVTRERHTLVTHGPYRWVRHPFYVAHTLAVTASALAAANWFLALAGYLTVGLLVLRTRTEERNLLNRFGSEYEAYRQRTGRFFPRFRRRRRVADPHTREVTSSP